MVLELNGYAYGAKNPAQQSALYLQHQRNIQNNMTKGGGTVPTFRLSGPQLISPNQNINSTVLSMSNANAQSIANNESAKNIGKPINGGKKSRKRKKNRKSFKRRKF